MRPLHPSLVVVERGLFSPSDEPPVSGEETHAHAPAEAVDEPVPAFLRQAFARREAALQLPQDRPPARGQIRALAVLRDSSGRTLRALAQPQAVLLRMQVAGAAWRGWVVSPYADYASVWDVVLGDDDAPVDPLAGMVQAWNEVSVVIDDQARLLAVLPPARLAAVEAVAAEFDQKASAAGTSGAEAQPGQVVRRATQDGAVLATGTPLAPSGDPRLTFQALYGRWAQECSRAAQARPVPAAGGRRQASWWASLGWRGAFAGAMVLLLVQGVALLTLERDDASPPGWRSSPAPGQRVLLRVIFAPDARQGQVQQALRAVDGRIVDGPNEHGEFTLEVAAPSASAALAQLRSTGVVDSAEQVRPSDRP